MGREEEENTQTDQMPALWTLQNMGEDMTDQEFNRYCAEVMGYEYHDSPLSDPINIGYTKNGIWYVQDLYRPHSDLSQMAEVFDKLMSKETFILMKFWTYKHPDAVQIPIAQAMREFIESTKGESE